MTKTLLIVYYSENGKTEKMATNIGKAAEKSGVKVILKKVEDSNLNDLVEADGIVVGSPTYFSNVSWQVKKMIDESIALYKTPRSLEKKIGGCFTSAGTRKDGEDCLKMLELVLLHHKITLVPGIVCESKDEETDILQTCLEYGTRIAKQLTA